MRFAGSDTRRGAALVLAIVVVLGIVIMVVGFLQTSLVFSERATEDSASADAMAAIDTGLAMAMNRVKLNLELDDLKEPDNTRTDGGREWNSGWVRGEIDKKNGTNPTAYEIQVWWSFLPNIDGEADGGTNDSQLVDSELRRVDRPAEWFKGKRFGFIEGDLAGLELTIKEFDKDAGTVYFETQRWAAQAGDKYQIPGGREYEFEAAAEHDYRVNRNDIAEKLERAVETWWWRQDKPIKKYNHPAAVVARGKVELSGTIEIDGRDHCPNGGRGMPFYDPDACPSDDHHILDDGVNGVAATGGTDISSGGASVGGQGDGPVRRPAGYDYTEDIDNTDDGADNDGDGPIDEDPWNGTDDDRDDDGKIVPDGERDEDARYPNNPDEILGLDKGTLKEIAKAMGTYFDSQDAFKTYVQAQDDSLLPGGKVYYLEIDELRFSAGGGIEMDMSGTDDPSVDPEELRPIIFIVHKEDADGNPISVVRELNLVMKGLLVVDEMNKILGNSKVIGGVQTLKAGNQLFGNGGAKIWFSSVALANLPSDVTGVRMRSSTWRQEP